MLSISKEDQIQNQDSPRSGSRNLIIVKTKTRLEKLTESFNTVGQAMFNIKQQRANFFGSAKNMKFKKAKERTKGMLGAGDVEDYKKEDRQYKASLDDIQKRLSRLVKVKVIDRSFLPSFLFTPDDIVVVIGQDGLVANTAKYVTDIPIIGVNPEPERFDGVLLPFNVDNYEHAVEQVLLGNYRSLQVTMAEASTNDGQRLLAFNDLFIGPSSHSSAKYQITHNGYTENHSSSGLIVSTGAGSTGWLSSLFNMAHGINSLNQLPSFDDVSAYAEAVEENVANSPTFTLPWDTNQLIFVVREPFLSRTSQISLSAGYVSSGNELVLESLMSENGVVFSDGIQHDFLHFNSGTILTVGIAKERAELVVR
ncbi:MAG: sugar kinase [Flammeovirgaceae bacterium]